MEFTRSMTKEEVKETLLKSFPKLMLERPRFFKCDSSKKLLEVNTNGFPTGEEVVDISSKESMYIVEGGCDVEHEVPFSIR